MWIRVRIDIGWNDLLRACGYCIHPGSRAEAERRAIETWRDPSHCLIALSVRSGFDLALRALSLPVGSEVLLSAWTVPDMARIVRAHGLVPVPVAVNPDGRVCVDSLRDSITDKSAMVVIAHLFGGRTPMEEIIQLGQQYQLIVMEDCAQSFVSAGQNGHAASDLVMHSFGPIKTATALGGAVVWVRDRQLRQRMEQALREDPVQATGAMAKKLLRFGLLKALSGPVASSVFRRLVQACGQDFDSLVNSLGRGFAADDLLRQLRRQPSTPLLRLLRRRMTTYDPSRIERRIELGRRMDRLIGREHDANHTFWVYPVVVSNPTEVRDRLVEAGFDATCRSRMVLLENSMANDSPSVMNAEQWARTVFLPWYPELTEAAIDEMAEWIENSPLSEMSDAKSNRGRELVQCEVSVGVVAEGAGVAARGVGILGAGGGNCRSGQ